MAKLFNLIIEPTLKEQIIAAQKQDQGMTRIREEIDDKKKACFTLDDQGVLWFKKRLVVPKDMELRKKILDEAHASMFTIHPGSNKMYQDLKQKFWWTRMKREIAKYVSECDVCQRIKADHLKPAGMLQPLAIPAWKWEDVHMDFIVGLPHTQKRYDSIWVVIDRLTKSAHFIPVKTTYRAKQYAELYISRIVSLHGVPWTITSDGGSLFVSRFWEQLQAALGTNLVHSSAYHPQTSGQVERSLEIAPFEALYGRRCRTPLNWSELGERVTFGPDLVTQAEKQKKKAISVRKGRSRVPSSVTDERSISVWGLFQIIKRCGPVAYRLELPPHLAAVHDLFHVLQLKKCLKVPEEVVDTPQIQVEPDLTYKERPIKIIDQKQRSTRRRTINFYKVQWSNHSEEE
ncbi:hypothetical protein U9M48_018972, partial [Paspalum notatum var. saurae]